MSQKLQKFINHLSKSNGLTLTSILSVADENSWEQNRHVILSTTPFLTLEMAVNRISNNRKRSSIPEPRLIHEAIEYVMEKRSQYAIYNNEKTEEESNAA